MVICMLKLRPAAPAAAHQTAALRAFTLIELLIVVAIIAILAAIALPNLLEAQTRSKVARVRNDLRVLATALESYHVDNNAYPQSNFVPRFRRFIALTTPIAYLSVIPSDPFQSVDGGAGGFRASGNYKFGAMPLDSASRWALGSDGPDLLNDLENLRFYPGYSAGLFFGQVPSHDYILYDPTNGTVSRGDVFRASDFNPSS